MYIMHFIHLHVEDTEIHKYTSIVRIAPLLSGVIK